MENSLIATFVIFGIIILTHLWWTYNQGKRIKNIEVVTGM